MVVKDLASEKGLFTGHGEEVRSVDPLVQQQQAMPPEPQQQRDPVDVEKLRVGMSLTVLSQTGKERACTIIEIGETFVRIHYDDFHSDFDEQLPKTSSRLLHFGNPPALAPAAPAYTAPPEATPAPEQESEPHAVLYPNEYQFTFVKQGAFGVGVQQSTCQITRIKEECCVYQSNVTLLPDQQIKVGDRITGLNGERAVPSELLENINKVSEGETVNLILVRGSSIG